MDDLDAAIRERLADAEHEDWCHERQSPGCCDGCDCLLGRANRALRAVLDVVAQWEIVVGRTLADEVRTAAATALGVPQDES